MSPDEYLRWFRSWQNPSIIQIPGSPPLPDVNISSGNMMPKRLPRNALQRIPLRNPLSFNVPDVNIPDMEIPNKANEMLRDARQQPRKLRYTGADLRDITQLNRADPPPRPISGNVPAVINGKSTAILPQTSATMNASALVPSAEGGIRTPFAGMNKPYIEGEFVRDGTGLSVSPSTKSSGVPPVADPPGVPPSSGGQGIPIKNPASRVLLNTLNRAAPYVSGALIAADVARRVTSPTPIEEAKSDLTNTLSSRGLGSSEVDMWVKNQFDNTPETAVINKNSQKNIEAETDPMDLTAEEMARAERNRSVALDFLGKLLPEGGLEYNKYGTNEKLPSTPSREDELNKFNRMAGVGVPTKEISPFQVTRPEGTASFSRGTGDESLPIKPTIDTIENTQAPLISGDSGREVLKRSNSFAKKIPGIANRISPENPYGADVVNGGVRTGNIRVGAATDAEAARNLVARAEQDKATQSAVAGFDRATEALKSLREARSPAFRFGADSIGAGPDALDVASGRVINRDTPAGSVSDAMANASRKVRILGGSRAAAQDAADKIANMYTTDKAVQQSEIGANAKVGSKDTPLDYGRFLLDQSRFGQQQAVDQARHGIDAENLKTNQAEYNLKKREYADKKRESFLSNFTYPDKGAPIDQIGPAVWQMSEASGVPPEEITPFFKAAADEQKIDWDNIKPKNFSDLSKRAMVLMTAAKRGQE